MSFESKTEKKHLFERPSTYILGGVIVIVLGFFHYQKDKTRYSSSNEKLNAIAQVKTLNDGFLEKLTLNGCYATNIIQQLENSFGSLAPISPYYQVQVRTAYKPVNYVLVDGKKYKIKSFGIGGSSYKIYFSSKNIEYKCLTGGYNYSTPYYFKSRDFKELSDFSQIELGPKLSAIESNKTIEQPIFNQCFEGLTVIANQPCQEKLNINKQ